MEYVIRSSQIQIPTFKNHHSKSSPVGDMTQVLKWHSPFRFGYYGSSEKIRVSKEESDSSHISRLLVHASGANYKKRNRKKEGKKWEKKEKGKGKRKKKNRRRTGFAY
jgi:hypothetical protein